MTVPLGQACTLGIVQGLSEVLPISSSAHLALFPWLLGWEDPGLAFDVALHLGTLAAFLFYFWRDWLDLLGAALSDPASKRARLLWMLGAATIPGAVAGLALHKQAETIFRNPALVACALIFFALWLYWADRHGKQQKSVDDLGWASALLIGLSQALAIAPGVSRSGITITAGLWEGLSRQAAARFSFLLATPIIFGAGVHEIHKIPKGSMDAAFFAGILCSAVSGMLVIHFLMRLLARIDFKPFVIYRIALGLAILGIYLKRGQPLP